MELRNARYAVAVFVLLLFILRLTYMSETNAQPTTSRKLKSTHEFSPQNHKHDGHGAHRAGSHHESQAGERRAYATYLSSHLDHKDDDDPYFTAVRVLAYQLLRQPSTRTRQHIPFLVIVPPHVPMNKTKILADEGATLVPVELLEATTGWTTPKRARFADQFTKLRIWGLTQYDRILYMDADMLLTKCLDDIWDEPVAQTTVTVHVRDAKNQDTLLKNTDHQSDITKTDLMLSPMPSSYLLASVSDTGGAAHPFPPKNGPALNGGFFMLRPSQKWLRYYISILNTPHSFDSAFMEQSLLNHVHRLGGPAPWSHFPPGRWNVNWPSLRDLQGGTASLHDKFWEEGNRGWIDRRLIEMWWRTQGKMEGYWQRRKHKKGRKAGPGLSGSKSPRT